MRVIIFSGKGGSGVTTLAAATAVAIANGGGRALAYGLGPGLAAALGRPPAAEVARAADRLWVAEGRHRHDSPDELREWLGDLLAWRGMESGLAEDLAALPGVSQAGRLLDLEARIDGGEFDVVVVDASPLAQFLELPAALDAAARWLERLFAPREQTIFEPFLRVFAGEYATAGDDVFERGRALLTRLAALRDRLVDPAVSTVRLVAAPERTSAGEAQATIAALSLFGYHVDAVAMNRLLPAEVRDPYFDAIRAEQEEAARDLASAVVPLRVLTGVLTRSGPRDTESLAALAADVYGSASPDGIMHEGPVRGFSQENGHHVFRLTLPYARREDLGLEQIDDGVAVHLAGRRCVVPLPPELRYREAVSWSFESQVLKVVF